MRPAETAVAQLTSASVRFAKFTQFWGRLRRLLLVAGGTAENQHVRTTIYT